MGKSKCKLCNTNNADKKNSHIISKFLGIDMFGEKSNRLGYLNSLKSKPQKIQDLPKEDFLYCESCERKFNTIETIIAKALIKTTKEEFENNFTKIGIKEIESNYLTVKEILLFFYINYLRLHHSNLDGVKEFKLEEETYQKIKQTTLDCLSEKLTETKLRIISSVFNYIPITVMTTDYEKDPSENLLVINQTKEHKIGILLCSNWMIHLYESESVKDDENIFLYKYHINATNKKFICLDRSTWSQVNETFFKGMIDKYDFKIN